MTAVGGNPTDRTVSSESDLRGGAGIGGGNNNNFGTGQESARVTLDSAGTVVAYGGMGAQAIGMGTNPPSNKSCVIEVGSNAGTVWMFNYDQVQSAVHGVTLNNTVNQNELSVPHHTIFWYNGTGTSLGAVAHACTENGAVDSSTYSWASENNIISITKSAADILSGGYDPGLHDVYDNWAVIHRAPAPEPADPVTLTPAGLIVYVGGDGYESVITDQNGEPVKTASDGFPEPGFTVELPAETDAALKTAVGHTSAGPLDLSGYLTFTYDDGAGNVRAWTLEHYDNKAGNTSISDGKYIYRILPATGQDPVRLLFTDESGNSSSSDDFEIELADQYRVYGMTIYPGALDPQHLKAVVAFPDGTTQKLSLEAGSAELIIRGVVNNGSGDAPTTGIITAAPSAEVTDITAQVPADTRFFINKSSLEVEHWDAVELLADQIVPQAQDILLERALHDFPSRLTEEYKYEFRYLDLVDTSNGNVWVTADKEVTLYWPYPEGTGKDTEFFIVHYQALDRQYDDDLLNKEYETVLYADAAQAAEMPLETTGQGIKITVDSFSPFALFWKDPAAEPSPSPVPSPSPAPVPTPRPETPDAPDTPDQPNVPDTPGQPAAPEGSEASNGSSLPQTGDTGMTGLWIVLCAGSLAGLLLSSKKKRPYQKRHHHKE